MFSIIRNWKRKSLINASVPVEWYSYLDKYILFYSKFTPKQKERFLNDLKIFIGEKKFFGAKDLNITDEIKVVVAAGAVRLTLFLDLSFYDRLTEIIIYPFDYKHPDEDTPVLGEAHFQGGTVILSWPAVLEGFLDQWSGHNTAYHEFAHILDRASGEFNGTPVLHKQEHYRSWKEIMSYHFLLLQEGGDNQLEAMDEYGSKNEAEFFAVATETFFDRPESLKENTPDLYQQLARFYRFDPIHNQGFENGFR